MPDDEHGLRDPVAAVAAETRTDGQYTPEPSEWKPDPELPPRPRRRLLGAGANIMSIALLGTLVTACGFIAGVLVEKGQGSSSAGAGSGLASRLSALRGSAAGGSPGPARFASGLGVRLGSGAGEVTIGEVTFVSGHTLYVSNAEGATIKVKTSAASTVTKTVKATVHGIHPGETVVVRGRSGASGALSAESIAVGGATGGGASLGGLFRSSGTAAAASGSPPGGAGAGGGPALFGE